MLSSRICWEKKPIVLSRVYLQVWTRRHFIIKMKVRNMNDFMKDSKRINISKEQFIECDKLILKTSKDNGKFWKSLTKDKKIEVLQGFQHAINRNLTK